MTLRVLVVDDEDDVRRLLRVQLETAGLEVVGEAADGDAALQACAAHLPDAVLLDLVMPGVSGLEAIPRLRADHPDVGIVAYTSVAGEFVRDEMARLGIPLVLKTGSVQPIVRALQASVRRS